MSNSKRNRARRAPAFYDPDNPPSEPFHRRERLNALLLEELSAVLRDEAGDPGLLDLRLLSAELSPDDWFPGALPPDPHPQLRLGLHLRLGYVAAGPRIAERRPDALRALDDASADPGDPRAVKTRTTEALERAAGFLKARALRAVEMKRAPDLRFAFLGVAVDVTTLENAVDA